MKTCPHCSKEIPVTKRKAKKWKLGYSVSKCKPASNDINSWLNSGWGIPESLNSETWAHNPSFSRFAFNQEKGVAPEYYSVERKNQ